VTFPTMRPPELLLIAACACALASATERNGDVGVILWAHGRSATDTYCGSLKETAHFKYCNGIKEGFNINHKLGTFLKLKNLKKCAKRGEMLTHIKPMHLKSYENISSHIDTPERLMEAARIAGYGIIVVENRANALARQVSSWELHKKSSIFKKKSREERNAEARHQFCKDNIKNYETLFALWERGVVAASKEGLTVIELNFNNVTRHLCESVDLTTRALAWCGRGRCKCRLFTSPHTKTSHHKASLAGRTSGEAARCVTEELKVDPNYAWMLNLSRVEK